MPTLVIAVLGVILSGTAYAHEPAVTYDRINLSVSAQEKVDNDTVIAELFSEREGPQADKIAAEVNDNVVWALYLSKATPGVSVQTAGYYSQPIYQKRVVVGWRVRQSIRLESTDAAVLSKLIGELQAKLAVASIVYTISPELRAERENALIVEALKSFNQRAKLVTGELGRKDYRVVHIDVVTSGVTPRPMRTQRMAMSMEAAGDAAPPAIESGVQTMQVGVNGVIELKPD